MKKIISFVFLCASCLPAAFADAPSYPYSASKAAEEFEFSGSNRVFVFNGLATAEITLTANVEIDTAVCRAYSETQTPIDLAPGDFTVDKATRKITITKLSNATGYVFWINNGASFAYIYVFDYDKDAHKIHSLDAIGDCLSTSVAATFSIPPMIYYLPLTNSTAVAERPPLERHFVLKYNTLRWNEDAEDFDKIEVSAEAIPRSNLTSGKYTWNLDSVYIDTRFTLTSTDQDQYAKAFGQTTDTTDLFIAQKPIVKATGKLTPREAKNERERGNDKARYELEGSAPVKVQLEAHANAPLANSFVWYIYEEQQPGTPVNNSREPSFNLPFATYGKYTARVTTTTEDGCEASDSILITVTDSEIDIPNVFTPNDDGINDKFCVAFKSIIKYNMWVYNRWGRLVFTSNSPENCWDGYIGNQKAASGAYYYKIEATGADGIKYKRAGDINLLR